MKLELLILTQSSRVIFLHQLLAILQPQCFGKDVKITIGQCNPSVRLGENREQMRKAATGDYVCFVDDDDLVSADYVAKILPLLHGGVDMIGFRVQQYSDGKAEKPTTHSLACGRWYHDKTGYYRDISHICPMRRELALTQPMEGGFGEDCRWANRMRGSVKTERFIDSCLYFYLYRSRKSDDRDCMDPFRLQMIEQIRHTTEELQCRTISM